MLLLNVCLDWFLGSPLAGIIMIAVAKLKETQVGILSVGVAHYALKTSEQQCLAHNAEVSAKRVHNLYRSISREGLEVGIVSGLCKRVVHYLVEAAADKLFSDKVLKLVVLVFLAGYGERRLELSGYLNIVVAIDAENVLNDVARTLNVNTISR